MLHTTLTKQYNWVYFALLSLCLGSCDLFLQEPNVSYFAKKKIIVAGEPETVAENFAFYDSNVYHYEQGLITRLDRYQDYSADQEGYSLQYHIIYDYDERDLLIKRRLFLDEGLNELSWEVHYSYNDDLSIHSLHSKDYKTDAASSDRTTFFELNENKLTSYKIDHSNGDLRTDNAYYYQFYDDSTVSVASNGDKRVYYYNTDGDLARILSNINIGTEDEFLYENIFTYENARAHNSVRNIVGTTQNEMILNVNPDSFDFSTHYLKKTQFKYLNKVRNGNWNEYEYVFDEYNRVTEIVEAESSYATKVRRMFFY